MYFFLLTLPLNFFLLTLSLKLLPVNPFPELIYIYKRERESITKSKHVLALKTSTPNYIPFSLSFTLLYTIAVLQSASYQTSEAELQVPRSQVPSVAFQGSLAACEFLLLNGAKLDRRDRLGRTPLHHATQLGNTG